MVQTRNGVQEFGRGWLFISPIKVLKSINLLRLAYRNNSISRAEMHSSITCFLNIVKMIYSSKSGEAKVAFDVIKNGYVRREYFGSGKIRIKVGYNGTGCWYFKIREKR
jgi:hypothetical protein